MGTEFSEIGVWSLGYAAKPDAVGGAAAAGRTRFEGFRAQHGLARPRVAGVGPDGPERACRSARTTLLVSVTAMTNDALCPGTSPMEKLARFNRVFPCRGRTTESMAPGVTKKRHRTLA